MFCPLALGHGGIGLRLPMFGVIVLRLLDEEKFLSKTSRVIKNIARKLIIDCSFCLVAIAVSSPKNITLISSIDYIVINY